MKRKFLITGHYFKSNGKKYYTIEQKILGIFHLDYIVPLLQYDDVDDDYIVTYYEYKFSTPNKALEVLQKLEEFDALNISEVQIVWDSNTDTYMYIPKNNLNNTIGYDDVLNKNLIFTNYKDALMWYNEIKKYNKSWVEKIVTFKNGKMC